jgi:hypothetical protein
MITSRGKVDIATHCDGTKGAALIADTDLSQSEARQRLDAADQHPAREIRVVIDTCVLPTREV